MHVVVFGAGSLGSLVGGLLARAHEVTLVGRGEHVRAVRTNGLRVTGTLDLTVHPGARTDPPASAGLVLVTVKAFDTADAADALASMDEVGAVLSLQNGMGNEETLAAALPWPVLAGTTDFGAERTAPGVVRCNGVGEVVLGPPKGGESATAERAGEAFRAAAIDTTVAADMPRRLWTKLAVNAGINPLTALARVDNGAVLAEPLAGTARTAARETVAAAAAAGVDLDPGEAVAAMEEVARDTADNVSSMRQDVEAGRRTEIDAINGYVVQQATEPVPVNRTLAALVGGWEAGEAGPDRE
ncbi:MAG: ketopantoate reductase family protein [Haloarculaceae archaeon]